MEFKHIDILVLRLQDFCRFFRSEIKDLTIKVVYFDLMKRLEV